MECSREHKKNKHQQKKYCQYNLQKFSESIVFRHFYYLNQWKIEHIFLKQVHVLLPFDFYNV